MNENLRRAVEALETGAADVRRLSARSLIQARTRLRQSVDEALTHLERDEEQNPDPGDVVSRLDRQAQEIAEDLRRVEKLMKRRTGQE
jgi:hypothetical protein